MPSREIRLNRGVVIAGLVIVAVLLVVLGAVIGSRRHTPAADPGTGTVTVPTAPITSASSPGTNGSGLLVEPAPASTDGGHVGPAGIRVGFDQSCKGAVEAATAYTEIGPVFVQYFQPSLSPSKVVAAIWSSTATAEDKRVASVSLDLTPSQAAELRKAPWGSYPSWGAFRVRSCMPGGTAAIDVWSCTYRPNPLHQPDPTNAAGRSCATTSYELAWQSSDWKIQHLDGPINAPTTDDFASPDRTPLTVAQRATVVGVVPGWQEYADAPR